MSRRGGKIGAAQALVPDSVSTNRGVLDVIMCITRYKSLGRYRKVAANGQISRIYDVDMELRAGTGARAGAGANAMDAAQGVVARLDWCCRPARAPARPGPGRDMDIAVPRWSQSAERAAVG